MKSVGTSRPCAEAPNKPIKINTACGAPFALAQYAFADARRVIAEDAAHSGSEKRYFCFGRVGRGVLTARFTYRASVIRMIGAGYRRTGKAIYQRENQIYE
jgi:uncharacterized protein